jgi:carbon-monoxide dehydrogenase medium subunit
LRGKIFSKEIIQQAYEALLATIKFRTSPQRATAEYRRELCGVLLDRVLHTAWNRAGQA